MNKTILTEEMVAQLEVMNTLNGGIAEPTMEVVPSGQHLALRIRVAGTLPERFHVKTQGRVLVVTYRFPTTIDGKPVDWPRVIFRYGLPPEVDTRTIRAEFHEGYLEVVLPTRKQPGSRNIPIRHEGDLPED